MASLNHWGIDEHTALQDINNLKNTITSKFKASMWDQKVLEGKRKLKDITRKSLILIWKIKSTYLP